MPHPDAPSPAPGKLRVGLMVSSLETPAWAKVMLERIRASAYADIVLVVRDASPQRPRASLWRRLVAQRRHLLYAAYRRLDARLFPVRRDAFASCDLSALLADVPVMDAVPRRTRHSDYFSDDDLAAIRAYDLDVLVRLGFRILRGGILTAARSGVWSFHHGDPDLFRGGPAGAWEVFLGQPTTGSVLQVLNEELDGGLVLYRSQSSTDSFSVGRNLSNYYWKTLSFLPRMLAELHRLGHDAFMAKARAERPPANFYSHRLYIGPTNGEMTRILWRLGGRMLRRKLTQWTGGTQWCLLARKSCGPKGSLHNFRVMEPPPDRFWADPCIVEHDGQCHVIIEEYINATAKGHIAVMTIGPDGKWPRQAQAVLERPYHLSYPFVFAWRDTYYMLVESSTNRSVEAYRAVEFPHHWEPAGALMENIMAVDATLHEHAGRWWLFANMVENDGASSWDELFLFHAAEPLAREWTPHPQNPVVSDVRCARPAGRLFVQDGKLIRPAQDCSGGYGRGIRFQEVLTLSKTEYAEREIGRIEPDWDPSVIGIHTFSSGGGWIVCDANRRRGIVGRGW
ncbi:MAG: hypothetical protein HYX69_10790 [Planctomycetia bacterium]|nr:hypothetical protein [Planctomycetia bacterium]